MIGVLRIFGKNPAGLLSISTLTFLIFIGGLVPSILIILLFSKYIPYPNTQTLFGFLTGALLICLVSFWASHLRLYIVSKVLISHKEKSIGQMLSFVKNSEYLRYRDFLKTQNKDINIYINNFYNIYSSRNICLVFEIPFYLFLIFGIYFISFELFIVTVVFPVVFKLINLVLEFTAVTIPLDQFERFSVSADWNDPVDSKQRLLDQNFSNGLMYSILNIPKALLENRQTAKTDKAIFLNGIFLVIFYCYGVFLVKNSMISISILVALSIVSLKFVNYFLQIIDLHQLFSANKSLIGSMFSFQDYNTTGKKDESYGLEVKGVAFETTKFKSQSGDQRLDFMIGESDSAVISTSNLSISRDVRDCLYFINQPIEGLIRYLDQAGGSIEPALAIKSLVYFDLVERAQHYQDLFIRNVRETIALTDDPVCKTLLGGIVAKVSEGLARAGEKQSQAGDAEARLEKFLSEGISALSPYQTGVLLACAELLISTEKIKVIRLDFVAADLFVNYCLFECLSFSEQRSNINIIFTNETNFRNIARFKYFLS